MRMNRVSGESESSRKTAEAGGQGSPRWVKPLVRFTDSGEIYGAEMGYCENELTESSGRYFCAPLVSWLINSQHKSIVIPGKLAIASATRNPGISKASRYRLPPVWQL